MDDFKFHLVNMIIFGFGFLAPRSYLEMQKANLININYFYGIIILLFINIILTCDCKCIHFLVFFTVNVYSYLFFNNLNRFHF